jgi:hypothetical protein
MQLPLYEGVSRGEGKLRGISDPSRKIARLGGAFVTFPGPHMG